MEPISMDLLVALAGGLGGEAGKQVWAGLSALVRRPFHRGGDTSSVSSGEVELVALEQAPADPARAHALSTVLAVRAALDAGFRSDLQRWHEQAKLTRTGEGDVTNNIHGGTFHAPVQQGRDFSGTSFTSPASPPSADDDAPTTDDDPPTVRS